MMETSWKTLACEVNVTRRAPGTRERIRSAVEGRAAQNREMPRKKGSPVF